MFLLVFCCFADFSLDLGAVVYAVCLQKPVDPSLFIHRFADRLDFKKRMHAVSNTALRLVASMKRDWMQTGAEFESCLRNSSFDCFRCGVRSAECLH